MVVHVMFKSRHILCACVCVHAFARVCACVRMRSCVCVCVCVCVHISRVQFLQVLYRDHPQRDMVALQAEVHFPNLHLSTTGLDFGCVLNQTHSQQELTVTNCSSLPVSYRWRFLEEQGPDAIRCVRGLGRLPFEN